VGCEYEHVYVEASDHVPPRTCLENRWRVIEQLPRGAVVAELDGDDELAHTGVLAHVWGLYANPDTWLTYGSFELFDGRQGFCAPYPSAEYRKLPWLASHLKTYRVELARHLVPQRDFMRRDGSWREHARDMAMVIPMLEMAGQARSVYVPGVTYRYSLVDSFEWLASPAERMMEEAHVMEIRALPPRARLEAL
jgi:hypothetical protein